MKTNARRDMDLCQHTWAIRPDPGDLGLEERWFANRSSVAEAPDSVPARIGEPWQRSLGLAYDGDIAWYATQIDVPRDWSADRTYLRFDSVANDCTVWINGRECGSHTGDSIPFEFDVAEHFQPGRTIDLVVRVKLIRDHITKGFHDVLSEMHGGIWLGARMLGTGELHVVPNGAELSADPKAGRVAVSMHLDRANADASAVANIVIRDPDGEVVAKSAASIEIGESTVRVDIPVEDPVLWSPDEPKLYRAEVELRGAGGLSERITQQIGFRSITTRDEQIIVNGRPVFLRGILHWGHEPKHISPAVPADELRKQFAGLKSFGFNCVCLCMWYPPEHFFDLADEMGLFIWQEHPNWQAPMEDEHVDEYKRLYREFMRRDVQHSSVVIVSATCEHPKFHPDVAEWWWKTAHHVLPNHLLQVQTSSFAWSNPDETDLYDEHTYESNNRWITYLDDLQEKLAEFDVPKPFVMGETVLFHSWPDLSRMQEILAADPSQRWWMPKALESRIQVEEAWRKRYGDDGIRRFRRQGDRHHWLGRKFQMELFRSYRNHAALVTNHIRDVNACSCGFMDDFDTWRFSAHELRPWLGDAALLLHTPNHRRSFKCGESIRCHIGVSNFSGSAVRSPITINLFALHQIERGERIWSSTLEHPGAEPGEVVFAPMDVGLPRVDQPTAFEIELANENVEANAWRMWVMPAVDDGAPDSEVYRLADLPFDESDAAPDEWEKGYSRGFGLPAKRWINRLPDPSELMPVARPWRHGEKIPRSARVIVTHKLTPAVLEYLDAGGAVLHFASKTTQAVPTICDWFFGQVPFVIEEPPLRTGDSDWMIDLLGFDLTRTYCRLIPSHQFEILDRIEPIVRLAFTHDLDHVRLLDLAFRCAVGPRGGRLIVSSMDHHDPVGRYLLRRFIECLLETEERAQVGRVIAASELAAMLNR